jgi:hypothetical protein
MISAQFACLPASFQKRINNTTKFNAPGGICVVKIKYTLISLKTPKVKKEMKKRKIHVSAQS